MSMPVSRIFVHFIQGSGPDPPEQTLSKLDEILDVASSEELNDMTEVRVGEPSPAKKNVSKCGVKAIRYEMEGFCGQCCESYTELAGADMTAISPRRPLMFPGMGRPPVKIRQFQHYRQSGGGALRQRS